MEPNAVQAAWNRDYVYLIGMLQQPWSQPPSRRICKIGRAHNLNSRMAQLQTGNPYPLELMASKLSDDAIALELQLHQDYAVNRIQGEWFDLLQGDIDDIKRIMAELG